MFLCSDEHTIAKMLDEVQKRINTTERPSGQVNCSVLKDKDCFPSQGVTVDLDFNVAVCCTLNGHFIH